MPALNYDWRAKCTSVVQRWGEARRKKYLTDVTFIIGEDEKASFFSAHTNVLAFSSPVFHAMFYGETPELRDPVAIANVAPEAFDDLLKYVYGEDVKMISISRAAKLYIAAEEYLIPDLKSEVETCISTLNMDDQQFWEIVVVDDFFQIPIIRNKCLNYLCENAASLFNSYLFSNVSSSFIEEILLLDEIKISEFDLLTTIVRWGMNNTDSEMKLKEKLTPFLPYIRFATLSTAEFCSFLNCHPGLIDSVDSLAIMKHLFDRSTYKLPMWCSTVSDKRNEKKH